MKFTLSWLKEHLATDAPLAQISETLTRVGLEVEAVHDPATALGGFTIARVLEAKQHPNADKLRVCLVETGLGGDPVQVVCGAPNARTGMKSVFSPPGTYIPGKDITLGVGTIRGVESRGMLVSAFEMNLSDDHEGIVDLPEDAPVGMPYADYLKLGDPVIEINLTPNRPDCTAVSGVARDLAAAGLGDLLTQAPEPVVGRFPCPVPVTLDLPADKAGWCPAFALRLVRGVENRPSPDWLQRRLTAIGLRPINALVDITNLVTFDRGRPLHVFDAKKVRGGLVVRPARGGETVLALDGRTYELDERACVIADENGVESIAGIMGGEHSGCDETTTDVLIESALWDPSNIAGTGRRLGIHTDARYRFERGVDPDFTVPGLELATALVLELCGGEPSEVTLAGAIPDTGRAIDMPVTEVKRLTGLDVSPAEMKLALQALGFWVTGQGTEWKVAPPSWRPDIEGKADLVEEIMRLVGVDRIPSTPLPRGDTVTGPVLTTAQKRTRAARRALAARGLHEAVTWSFIPKAEAQRFGGGADDMDLANPISVEMSTLRPSLLPGLVAAAQRNADRGMPDAALFELGQVFHGPEPGDQTVNAAGVRRGAAKPAGAGRHWQGGGGAPDAFDAKADALAALSAAGAPVDALQIGPGAPAWFHPGRSGVVRLGPNVIGAFGELHPAVLEAAGASGPLVAFELVLDRIPQPKAKPSRAKGRLDASALLPVRRDFAFVVDGKVAAGDIVRAAKGADKQLIERVSVFDVYAGDRLPAGKKSVAIEVVLQPRERTMTDAEIEAVAAEIVAQVAKATGASLRT